MIYTFPVSHQKTTRDEVNLGVNRGPTSSGYTDPFEEDTLYFMETFSFPDLRKVKASLQKSNYSEEQIKEIIEGLKTLL